MRSTALTFSALPISYASLQEECPPLRQRWTRKCAVAHVKLMRILPPLAGASLIRPPERQDTHEFHVCNGALASPPLSQGWTFLLKGGIAYGKSREGQGRRAHSGGSWVHRRLLPCGLQGDKCRRGNGPAEPAP